MPARHDAVVDMPAAAFDAYAADDTVSRRRCRHATPIHAACRHYAVFSPCRVDAPPPILILFRHCR